MIGFRPFIHSFSYLISIPPLSCNLAGDLCWNFVLTFALNTNFLIRTNCAPQCKIYLCVPSIVKAEIYILPNEERESSVGASLVYFLILSEYITSVLAAKMLG